MLRLAFMLAEKGRGLVEPNPLVGCVVVHGDEIVGEGWHAFFGGPHAEVVALKNAGARAAGATVYVTLEPCRHQGKTPPCTQAIIDSGAARVVAAVADPCQTAAGGAVVLRQAGLDVELGVMEQEAKRQNAPFFKLIAHHRPWVIAKWAMSLDGKIATRTGESRWISNAASRRRVHELRGRVDGIMVGSGTAQADDPLLTARPPGLRTATRIVVDSRASLSPQSRLAATAREAPVLVAVGPAAEQEKCRKLEQAGCEVWRCGAAEQSDRLAALLDELGRRKMTNVLVEGGGSLLGSLFDQNEIDEVHAFIAPRIIGGAEAIGPLAGRGVEAMNFARHITDVAWEQLDGDLYLHGPISRPPEAGGETPG